MRQGSFTTRLSGAKYVNSFNRVAYISTEKEVRDKGVLCCMLFFTLYNYTHYTTIHTIHTLPPITHDTHFTHLYTGHFRLGFNGVYTALMSTDITTQRMTDEITYALNLDMVQITPILLDGYTDVAGPYRMWDIEFISLAGTLYITL